MQKQILMVLDQEFPPDDRVFKEAQSLISAGFGITIACYTFSDKPTYENFKGIHIYRKKISQLVYKSSVAALKFPLYFMWWKNYIKTLFNQNKYHIVHIHDLPLSAVGVYIKQEYNTQLVIDLHENWPSYLTVATHTNTFFGKILSSNRQWQDYERNILKHADIIVTVVEEMTERIASLGHNTEKIVALPNTIIPEEYAQLEKTSEKNRFTLFFAGGINIERGLQYVIPALALVKDKIPDFELQIVGKGSYLATLEDLVRINQLENHVAFLGWKPLKEVLLMTAQADITLIPHIKWEQTDCSSPNKLFQCMLAKTPLLVSNCGSVERIVLQTESGLSYPYNDLHAFADRLVYLYQNKEIRQKMGENGYKWVKAYYNWPTTSKPFIDKYRSL